jgi:hypothetical protein
MKRVKYHEATKKDNLIVYVHVVMGVRKVAMWMITKPIIRMVGIICFMFMEVVFG